MQQQARNKCRKLSSKEKNVKREQYERNRYQNMSEENLKRLKEYQQNYRRGKTSR